MRETSTRQFVLARVSEALAARADLLDHPLRVGIDGRSAAGKTHMAGELEALLRGRGRTVVRSSIDQFHRKGHKYRSERGEWTPESRLAEGLDYAAFRESVLEPLGPGGSRRIRPRLLDSYHDEYWPEEWVDVPEQAILVSDAGHGFVPGMVSLWDYRIWLDVSAEAMVARASGRDIAWAGTRDEVRKRYETFWVPTDALYAERHNPRGAADCVIDNNDFERPVILRGP